MALHYTFIYTHSQYKHLRVSSFEREVKGDEGRHIRSVRDVVLLITQGKGTALASTSSALLTRTLNMHKYVY